MAKVQIIKSGGGKGVAPLVGGKISKTKLIGKKPKPAVQGGGNGGGN